MKRTIKLTSQSESALHELAAALGIDSEEMALELLAERVLEAIQIGPKGEHTDLVLEFKERVIYLEIKTLAESVSVRSTPDVMGGDTCIRNTRIPIWLLIQYKRQGMSDSEILAVYPPLNAGNANQRIPDPDVLSYSRSESRVLLTNNRADFRKLYLAGSITQASSFSQPTPTSPLCLKKLANVYRTQPQQADFWPALPRLDIRWPRNVY